MTRLATAGMAAHVFFELAAGVGMPLASLIGPVPAAGLWAAGTRTMWRAARTGPPSRDPVFAVFNGMALAAVIAHLAGWPRRRSRLGLPWLTDCEGLGEELMPVYNWILYASGTAALLALLRENRSAPAHLSLLPLTLTPALVAVQHGEHRRLRERARLQPGWWNRRLRADQREAHPR
jgi:hypothetical protein